MNILSYMVTFVSDSTLEFAKRSDKNVLSRITGCQKTFLYGIRTFQKSPCPVCYIPVPYQEVPRAFSG